MRKGFTLLELILVLLIIGILATMGSGRYVKVIESSRTAEAIIILGSIRTFQAAYKLEHNAFASSLDELAIKIPTTCEPRYFFSYSLDPAQNLAIATRCTEGGKKPNYELPYTITTRYDLGT